MRALLLAAAAALLAPSASAQLAVGGQVGDPTGLSLKLGQGAGAVLVAVGWDLDDSVAAEAHYLLSARRLRGARTARLFYGPGAFVVAGDDDERFGISLGLGAEGRLAPEVEVYGLVSPRLRLSDETEVELGAGLGLRLRL